MRLYELTYLISPKLTQREAEIFSEKITSLIEGGVLGEIKKPNKVKLSYPIKKAEEGYLASLNFYTEPERLNDLEKKLKSEPEILRYLILAKKMPKKVEIFKEIPKIKKLEKPKKVELEDIEKKLEEILGE